MWSALAAKVFAEAPVRREMTRTSLHDHAQEG
jgi:hypothetical protein